MILFNKQLKMMAEDLENEKQRIIRYQQDTDRASQNFN